MWMNWHLRLWGWKQAFLCSMFSQQKWAVLTIGTSGEMFWVVVNVIWILITYSKSLNQLSLQRKDLVGGLQRPIPAKQTSLTEPGSFYFSSLPHYCSASSVDLSAHFWIVNWHFFEIFFIHLDICAIKSLSSLELVRDGCLLNDLYASRGVDVNLFGHGMGL